MAIDIKTHDSFVTTTRGLRRDIPPMILYERSKRLGDGKNRTRPMVHPDHLRL